MYGGQHSDVFSTPQFLLANLFEHKSPRVDFATRLQLTGHCSDEEWVRLVNQHLRVTGAAMAAEENAIAEHVLPESWVHAA